MSGDITMFDSADDTQFPRGAQAYAAYVDGAVDSQPNYDWIVAEFPNAYHLSITLSAGEDAEVLDIENGAASPQDAAGWWQRQRKRGLERPCLYASASVMQARIVPLVRSGAIARPLVRLWSAHYAGQHICSPRSCGAVSIDMDGTQWTDQAWGRNLDESLLLADFFSTPPAPKPAPPPIPAWQEAMMQALPELRQGSDDAHLPYWYVHRVQAIANDVYQANPRLTVDGVYGAETATAVAVLQHAHGLTDDGIVGPATWALLVTGSAP